MKLKLLLIIALGIACLSFENTSEAQVIECDFIGKKYGDRHTVYQDTRTGQWNWRTIRNGVVLRDAPIIEDDPEQECNQLRDHYGEQRDL